MNTGRNPALPYRRPAAGGGKNGAGKPPDAVGLLRVGADRTRPVRIVHPPGWSRFPPVVTLGGRKTGVVYMDMARWAGRRVRLGEGAAWRVADRAHGNTGREE